MAWKKEIFRANCGEEIAEEICEFLNEKGLTPSDYKICISEVVIDEGPSETEAYVFYFEKEAEEGIENPDNAEPVDGHEHDDPDDEEEE